MTGRVITNSVPSHEVELTAASPYFSTTILRAIADSMVGFHGEGNHKLSPLTQG
ncbi:hypothetical protein [Nostoc sp.]|uniref:hypothetical protein n=1 Tax=Nostoc sp. TaxID=1180 RepID=UPI002FF77CE6